MGHFKGSQSCKSRVRSGHARMVDHSSQSDNNSSACTSEEEYSSDEDNQQQGKTNRLYQHIPTIRKVGGKRIRQVQKTQSRYKVDVIVNQKTLSVFADTGADINVMSLKNAKKLKLDMQPTKMKIRPYGSRAKTCVGEHTCTVMYNSSIANAKFYILNEKVETLISGPVAEELNIIKFNVCRVTSDDDSASPLPPETKNLIKRYPSIFSGIGTLKDYEVKLHIDKSVTPVHQPARTIPFHLRDKVAKRTSKDAGV